MSDLANTVDSILRPVKPSKIDDPEWRKERARKAGLAAQRADVQIRRLAKLTLTADECAALAAILAAQS